MIAPLLPTQRLLHPRQPRRSLRARSVRGALFVSAVSPVDQPPAGSVRRYRRCHRCRHRCFGDDAVAGGNKSSKRGPAGELTPFECRSWGPSSSGDGDTTPGIIAEYVSVLFIALLESRLRRLRGVASAGAGSGGACGFG
eukprot:545402-Prorocentrum_minimum.AAC.2